MKYFTMQWWSGDVEDVQRPGRLYREYLDSVVQSLPDALRLLEYEVNLHDARLRMFAFSLERAELVLELDGCGYDQSTKDWFDRQFRLTYTGIQSIISAADPQSGLPGPHGYGDLGYDEIEIVGPSLYEHRMLFSTGIELCVRFTDFALKYHDSPTKV